MSKHRSQKEINDWIESLSPVVIEIDEQGNMSPIGLEALNSRIREAVSEIKQSEPDSEPSEPDA